MSACPLTPAEIAAARSAFSDANPDCAVIRAYQERLGFTGTAIDGIAGRHTFDALEREEARFAPDGHEAPGRLHISAAGLALIKKWEAFKPRWYRDGGGVLTIGYGHTGLLRHGYVSPITKAQAAFMLEERVEREYASAVRDAVGVPVTQNEFDAMVSLCYNIGSRAFRGSTLLRKLNRGDRRGAARGFDSWVFDNGKRIKGLENRRADERKLFERP